MMPLANLAWGWTAFAREFTYDFENEIQPRPHERLGCRTLGEESRGNLNSDEEKKIRSKQETALEVVATARVEDFSIRIGYALMLW